MSSCDSQILSSFVDDELPPEERARVAAHLAACERCAVEVAELRRFSILIASDDLGGAVREDELARIHAGIENEIEDVPILRIGFVIGTIAASILIVSCAWLMDLRPGARTLSPRPSVVSGGKTQVTDWERTAMTLRPGPVQRLDPITGNPVEVVDSELADWMLKNLGAGTQRVSPTKN